MWELSLAYAHDHLQLLLAEHDLLIVILVIYRAQGLAADVITCQQRIQLISPLGLGNLATLQHSTAQHDTAAQVTYINKQAAQVRHRNKRWQTSATCGC